MAFWHPFADMGAVAQRRVRHRARRGRRGSSTPTASATSTRTASLWYANLGHGRAEIADAVAAQMRKLEAYHTFADVGQPARRTSSARRWPSARRCRTPRSSSPAAAATRSRSRPSSPAATSSMHGQPERVHLISRTQGYHGTHGFGTSLGGIEANVTNWGPLVPQTSTRPVRLAARARGRDPRGSGRTRSRRSSASR